MASLGSGSSPDLLVVGGGVWGTWTALWARRLGASVTLLEANEPGHAKSTSGDHSRIIRHAHGTDDLLAGWAQRSLAAWLDLESLTGASIFVPTGVAWCVSDEGVWERESEVRLRAANIPVERLTPDEAVQRWPSMSAAQLKSVLYEPTAGFLRAAAGVRAAARALAEEGGVIVRGSASASADCKALDENGTPIVAGAVVWACGPWLPALFPDLVGRGCEAEIAPVRRDAVYFAANDMEIGAAPTWVDEGQRAWGMPGDGPRGVKVGPEMDAGSFDPSAWPDEAHPTSIAAARAAGGLRFPAIANAPIVESRACQHERTKSGHYVLDHHPRNRRAFIAGGGSGHGYKQGPAVGEFAARAALNIDAMKAPDRRFAISKRDNGPESPMGDMGAPTQG